MPHIWPQGPGKGPSPLKASAGGPASLSFGTWVPTPGLHLLTSHRASSMYGTWALQHTTHAHLQGNEKAVLPETLVDSHQKRYLLPLGQDCDRAANDIMLCLCDNLAGLCKVGKCLTFWQYNAGDASGSIRKPIGQQPSANASPTAIPRTATAAAMKRPAFLARDGTVSPEATQQAGMGGPQSVISDGDEEARPHRPSFLKGIGSCTYARACKQRGAEANTCMTPRTPTGASEQRPRYLKGLGSLAQRQPAASCAQPEDSLIDGAGALIDEAAEQDLPQAAPPACRRSSKRRRHEHGYNEAAQVTALELAILTAGVLLPRRL